MAGNPVQDQMLETFVKYASIDSQSNENIQCTPGQHDMALALKADVEDAIARNGAKGVTVVLSEHNYLYVRIPANVRTQCPSLGISCHLDVTPDRPGFGIRPIIDTLDGHTIVRTDGTTLLGADDKCGCTIQPWTFEQEEKGIDVTVQTRIRYFDKAEGERFDRIIKDGLARVAREFPNVRTEILFDGLQYENVAYTLHPRAQELIENAAAKTGKQIRFIDERAGTTASMFAAKGLNGGMCLFSGQHEIHSVREYADLQEMEEAYNLMLEVIRQIPALK